MAEASSSDPSDSWLSRVGLLAVQSGNVERFVRCNEIEESFRRLRYLPVFGW